MWGTDLIRSIDDLEMRQDIDVPRIAYFGLSLEYVRLDPRLHGGKGPNVAGLHVRKALPEADGIKLCDARPLNGEFDFFFPQETSQSPLFEHLGTPPGQKKRLVFPGGHSVPRTEMIKESPQWLGQVSRGGGR